MNEIFLTVLIAYGMISFLINVVYLYVAGDEIPGDKSFFTIAKYYYAPIHELLYFNLNKCGYVLAMIAFQIVMFGGEAMFFSFIYLVCFPIFMLGKLFCKIFEPRLPWDDVNYILGEPPAIGDEFIVDDFGKLKTARVVKVEQDVISSNKEKGVFVYVKFIRRKSSVKLTKKGKKLFREYRENGVFNERKIKL